MRGTWGTRQKRSPQVPKCEAPGAPGRKIFRIMAIVLNRRGWAKTLGQGGSSKLEGKGIEMRRYFWMAVAGGAWAAWAAVACGAQSTPAAATAPRPRLRLLPRTRRRLLSCLVRWRRSLYRAARRRRLGKQKRDGTVSVPRRGEWERNFAYAVRDSGEAQRRFAGRLTLPVRLRAQRPVRLRAQRPCGFWRCAGRKKGLDGDFPFPGEEGKDAAVSGTRDASGGSDANSSNSSSSSSSSGDDAGDPAGRRTRRELQPRRG